MSEGDGRQVSLTQGKLWSGIPDFLGLDQFFTTHNHDRNDGQMKQRVYVRKMIVRRTIFYDNLASLTYLGGGSLDLH